MSNTVFLFGSSLQTLIGIFDLKSVYDDEGGDDDGAENDDDDDWTRQDNILYVLGIVGAGMYILNAASDYVQAKAWDREGQGRFGSNPKYEIWAAITFGVAAVLETITCIFWTEDINLLQVNIYVVAMHIYFVSGALSLIAQGMSCSFLCRSAWSCSCCNSKRVIAKIFMDLGAILFLVGSTVDVVVSYLYEPAIGNLSPGTLAATNLLSSILWFCDALLYIAADCVIYSLFRRPVRCFAVCEQRKIELPTIISTREDDNASSKLQCEGYEN